MKNLKPFSYSEKRSLGNPEEVSYAEWIILKPSNISRIKWDQDWRGSYGFLSNSTPTLMIYYQGDNIKYIPA